jgi:glycerol-1-phosphate dehydrogenase [NAD(P)+]
MTLAQPHRSVRIPRLLRLARGMPEVVAGLSELLGDERPTVLVVHGGPASPTGYGAVLTEALADAGFETRTCEILRNDEPSVSRTLAAIAEGRVDLVVGVGGGRIVDVGKLAAARAGVDFVSVPTQAASDGICSPVAVILDARGRPRSLGARIPLGIVVDMQVLERAPRETWLAGLGDLVSNLSAVRDWRLAHRIAGEPIDDFACLTAEAAAGSVVDDDADLGDPDFRATLIRGLILSGIAMEMAGSSRPASGSEHLISHALDATLAEPRPHGMQVALATVAAHVLRGDPCARLVAFHRRVGLPVVPSDLGLTPDDVLRAVDAGPRTRPGRWTALDLVSEEDRERLRSAYDSDGAGIWR